MTQTQANIEELLREGGAALRGGERERARALLAQAVRLNPRSEQAWLLLAGAVTDAEQRRTCLERVLRLNPEHTLAQRAMATLQPAAPRPQPAAPATPAAGSLLGRLRQPEQAAMEEPRPAPPAAPRPAAPQPLSFDQLVAAPTAPAPPAAPRPAAPQPLSFDQLVATPAPNAAQLPAAAAPAPAVEAPAPVSAAQVVSGRPAAISNLIELSAAGVRRKARERQLWMAVLAVGVLMMLTGLGLLGIVLLTG